MKEIWRPIPDYEGLYEVSNLGRVKNRKNRIIKQNLDKYGYPRFGLWKNGKHKCCHTHRAVALAFCHNPDPQKFNQINHKDEIKTNNNYLNLEWCDNDYNHAYGTCGKRAGIKNSIPVVARVIATGEVERYASMTEAARCLGADNSHISQAVNGKRKQAYGRTWEKYEDN